MIVKVIPSNNLTDAEVDKFKAEFTRRNCYLNVLTKLGLGKFSLEDNDVNIIVGNKDTMINNGNGRDQPLGDRPYIYRHVILKNIIDGDNRFGKSDNVDIEKIEIDSEGRKIHHTPRYVTEVVLNFEGNYFESYPIFIAIAFGDILSEQYSGIMCERPVNDEFFILRSGLAMYFAAKILEDVDKEKIWNILDGDVKSFYGSILSSLMYTLQNEESSSFEELVPRIVDLASGFAAIHGKIELEGGERAVVALMSNILVFQNEVGPFFEKVIYDKKVSPAEYNGMILQIRMMENMMNLAERVLG